jgi:hypothetical protein
MRLQAAISAAQLGKHGSPPPPKPRRFGRAVPITLAVALAVAAGVGGYLLYNGLVGWPGFGHSPLTDAISPAASNNEVVVFAGNADALTASPGNTIEEDPAGGVVWIKSSVRTATPRGATDGVSLKIPSSVSDNAQARPIRVTISAARKDGADSSAPFAISYSTDGGNSGWRVFQPTNEFNDFSFNYRVPNVAGGTHVVGIWADIAGRSIPLAVRRITVSAPR